MAAPPILPTSFYPRFRYGAPPVTLDFLYGLADWLPSEQGLRGGGLTGSGKIEYLFNRVEEAVSLTVICEAVQYAHLRRAYEDVLMLGTQFEVWVDRFTGSCWCFAETLKDQNGLALGLNTGTAAYADGDAGRALSLGASQRLSVATAQASASPTKTGFDDPFGKAEGVILLDFRPTWASTDGTQRYLLDTTGTTSNRLRLFKTAGNVLTFEILDNAAGAKSRTGSPTWAANDRVEIFIRWTTAGALQLWVAVNAGAFIELTGSAGAGTGLITTLGATFYMGSDNAAANFAPGVYQGLVCYPRAFPDPYKGLRSWRSVWRSYWPYAEVTVPAWQPQRVMVDPMLWSYPVVIRLGTL